MNSTDSELTHRMLLSSTIEAVPPRRQMFIPHVDGAFISRFIRLGFILAIVFSCIGYFFIQYASANQTWRYEGAYVYSFPYYGLSGNRRQAELLMDGIVNFKKTTCLEVKVVVQVYEGRPFIIAGPEYDKNCIKEGE